MDDIKTPIFENPVKQMAYNVNCFIQNETNYIVSNLTEVKEGISQFTTSLFEMLDKIIDTMNKNKLRTVDSILNVVCNIISEIQIETAEAIYIRIDKLASTVNNLKNVQQRTSDATKISLNNLVKINRNANNDRFVLKSKPKPVIHLDSKVEIKIKNCFNNLLKSKKDLTVIKVRTILQEENNFHGSFHSLHGIINNMGFDIKNSNSQEVLIESQKLCNLRVKYLNNIIKFQEEARPIVYINHLSVDPPSNAKDNKLGSVKVQEPIRVICAASIKGMVPNSLLVFNRAFKMDTGDNINIGIYKNWCQMQLLPNIPPMSVVILDYSLYHEDDTFCLEGSTKAEMQAWLVKKKKYLNKSFTTEVSEEKLSEVIKSYMENLFSIDELLVQKGHDVVHLPKYLAELNPLKMAFNEFKQHMHNTNINDLIKLIEENKRLLEGQQWEEIWCAVKSKEHDYTKRYNIVINGQTGDTPRPYQVFIVTDTANENEKCELTREDNNEVISISDNETSNTPDMEYENVLNCKRRKFSLPS